MAVMEMVDTKMLTACSMATNLHITSNMPKGQYFERISNNVIGMVITHNSKSEIIAVRRTTY